MTPLRQEIQNIMEQILVEHLDIIQSRQRGSLLLVWLMDQQPQFTQSAIAQ